MFLAGMFPLEQWQQIRKMTIGTARTSFDFTGLDGDIERIYLITAFWVNGSGSLGTPFVRPNGDAGSNYGFQLIQGTASTPTGFQSTTATGMPFGDTGNAERAFTVGLLYARSGRNRTMLALTAETIAGTTVGHCTFIPSVWNNATAVIKSLVFTHNTANGIGIGSHIELWAKR